MQNEIILTYIILVKWALISSLVSEEMVCLKFRTSFDVSFLLFIERNLFYFYIDKFVINVFHPFSINFVYKLLTVCNNV